ncbi:MAG: hypothetical protein HS126_30405 [Anaerolineales bacterium]|nr:hypothetical protein [Anaerolineales bacterium]
MTTDPKRILVVYYNRDDAAETRLTMTHHIRTLDASDTKHDIIYYNAFNDYPSPQLGEEPLPVPIWAKDAHFDAAILHYSFLAFHWNEMALIRWKRLFHWIGEMNCLKAAIPQDEYDRAGLLDEWLFEWDVAVVFSCFDADKRGPLYPFTRNRAKFEPCLTGYIDEKSAQQYKEHLLPLHERKFDIVYRARHLPFWYGSAGQLKYRIGDVVAAHAQRLGFTCDISTRAEDTIPGSRWLDFLASSRAVIGCESGVSVVDWRGEVEAQVRAILRAEPGLSFEEVSARMPAGWDSYRFLAISPRHFEAIITKTCQILVEGDYSGVLEPNKHYIPLKPDFSNLDEALDKLRDDCFVNEMVERAYHDIYLTGKYTYRAFAHQMEEALFNPNTWNNDPLIITVRDKEKDGAMDRTLQSLERQLIVERHNYALQEAKLLEARQYIGELTGQLQVRVNELQNYMQLHFDDLQAHLESKAQLQENLQQQLKTQLQISRKEVIVFAVLLALGSAVISAGLMLVIMFSLRY